MSVHAGIDLGPVQVGAERIGQAAEAIGQAGRQVGGVPPAAAPRQQATDLLDRVIEALARALQIAETELTHHSSALTSTANSYQQTEELLAQWHVPGWGA